MRCYIVYKYTIKFSKKSKEDIAQIQSIIAREMSADIDDIHIMNK